MACNRDGLLALFGADGSLVATRETSGKPISVTAFTYDESGQGLDKLLVDEFSWGTGVVARDSVVYRFTDNAIMELWTGPVWLRASHGSRKEYLDGFVRLSRGVFQGHGPLLTYGVRDRSGAPYREQTLEVTADAVRPFSGPLE
jgi:hypothetical protein